MPIWLMTHACLVTHRPLNETNSPATQASLYFLRLCTVVRGRVYEGQGAREGVRGPVRQEGVLRARARGRVYEGQGAREGV